MDVARSFRVILAAGFLANLSLAIHRGVFTNFAADELGLGPGQFGLLEGIRELPGLFSLLLAAMTARVSEQRLYAICVALISAGVWWYAGAHGFGDLVVATLVSSVGFHLWWVVQESLILQVAGPQERALRLGRVYSVAAAATLGGMAIVWALGAVLALRPFFVMGGVVGLIGAAVALSLPRPAGATARRAAFLFRWQYRSYYVLMVFLGARRHMVLTFATFALVKLYGTPVQGMALLLAVHSLLAIWTRPLLGRLIDRWGEQKSLALSYGLATVLFLSYALVREPAVVYALFILDNVFSGLDVAVAAHAGRIVPKQELGPTLAMGLSANHIFGVSIPVLGGMLWEWFGPVVPFLTGAAIAVAALIYSLRLERRPALAAGG